MGKQGGCSHSSVYEGVAEMDKDFQIHVSQHRKGEKRADFLAKPWQPSFRRAGWETVILTSILWHHLQASPDSSNLSAWIELGGNPYPKFLAHKEWGSCLLCGFPWIIELWLCLLTKTAALLTLQLLRNFNDFENGLASSDHSWKCKQVWVSSAETKISQPAFAAQLLLANLCQLSQEVVRLSQ